MGMKRDFRTEYQQFSHKIAELEKLTGCKFNNPKYALQAITCSEFANSYKTMTNGDVIFNQDVLATLGDTILKMLIAEDLFLNVHGIKSGSLTIAKSKKESNKALSSIADRLDIKSFMYYQGSDLSGHKKLATCLEAIIGAIYLTNGISHTRAFVKKYILHTEELTNLLTMTSNS